MVRFGSAMDAIGVEYMITGSTAMNFYAVARMTRDIDIVIRPRPGDDRLIAKVLAEDFEADAEVIADAVRGRHSFSVVTPGSAIALDIMIDLPQLNSPEVFARRRAYGLGDDAVSVISPEDLAVAKLYWARDSASEMQLGDVANLLSLPGLDREYIRRQAARLRVLDLLASVERGMGHE